MRVLSEHHPVRHLTCQHIKCLHISHVNEEVVLVENTGSSYRHLHGQLHKHYSQFTDQ